MTTTATDALTATSTKGLLTAYAALTHRIDHATVPQAVSLHRAQRDLIEAEILRRTGDA